jgi:hypothetical protein
MYPKKIKDVDLHRKLRTYIETSFLDELVNTDLTYTKDL